MKIVGITRIRNEEHMISDTLDHVAKLVDEIIVYDDCSEDNTVDICKSHKAVAKVIKGKKWESGSKARNEAEGDLRQIAYEEAVKIGADWVYCFDADEFADFEGIDFTADAYKLRLFDFYITENDKNKHYSDRKWMGKEYRDILMLFRVQEGIRFFQREPRIPNDSVVEKAGWVKHYGKAISTKHWEETCDYYINHRWNAKIFKKHQDKWKKRRGRSVHSLSDFGNPLIRWCDREKLGIKLTEEIEQSVV